MVKAKSFNSVQPPRNKSYLALVVTASIILSLSAPFSWAAGKPNEDSNSQTDASSTTTNIPTDNDGPVTGTQQKDLLREALDKINADEIKAQAKNMLAKKLGIKTDSEKKEKEDKDKKAAAEGQCQASGTLGENCQQTYDWIESAKLTNTLTQAAGSTVVGTTNQIGAMKAQNAGTQTAIMEAAANSQEKAGMLQTTTGLSNAAMGAYQIMLSREHMHTGEKLKDDLAKVQPNAAVSGASAGARNDPATLQKAIQEQKLVEKAAMMSGVQSMITGVTQTASGALAIGAAKQAKEMAGKLSEATGSSYQLTSTNPDTGALNPTTTTVINPGTNSDPAVATTDGNISASDNPTITPPVNPDSVAGGPGAGPVAGAFQSGNPKGAGGGGGSPNLGVGSMSPAKAEPEQTGARMAESKSNTAYSQGGGSGYAAGAGVSAEKSADLGFLANLLPKPQEEMGKNGILDYGTAGRSPAGFTPYSFLGKDVNIFQRISDRTTAKLKSGDIGS